MSSLLSSLSGHFFVSCVLFCVLLNSSHAWKQWSNTEVVPSDIDGTVVPTYHFDMIRDTARNTAFYKALKQVIRPNVSNVLDLGSGSGLLAMMAVQAGARSVTAIERNDALYDLSTRIFKKNQMASHIDVLHGESFDLVPEDIDAKNLPIHVLVAEVLDSWIIGEGFVSSLADLKMRCVRTDFQ
jgi:predicted RNA methylase